LPELFEPGDEIGEISSSAAEQFGLQKNVKIMAGAGDQQAAAIGVGAFNEGIVSIGIGTSSALSITIAKPIHIKEGTIVLNCAAVPGKWEYEPPIWNTGSLIKWYHDQMDETSSYEDSLSEAEKLAPGSDGLLAIPYFSGAGSPRWDAKLSGGFYGLSLTHSRIHFLRALMEAIAYEIRFNIELIEKSGVDVHRVILSGGASQNTVLCGIVADVLQKPVQIFSETEASTWGMYVLIRSKLEKKLSLESLHKSLHLEFKNMRPDPEKQETYDKFYSRYLKLGNALSQLKF
jgi:sugar (pentulose or hexulose) kinase